MNRVIKQEELKIIIILTVMIALCLGCNTRTQKALAKEQIKNLKTGCLIVRLKKKEGEIAKLKELGLEKKAINEALKTERRNKDLMAAFKDEFDFCPVYFVYSDQSEKIKEEKIVKVLFLNRELEVDSAIMPKCSYIMTAELSYTKQDTAKYYNQTYLYTANSGKARRESYWGGSNINITSIVLMSNKFLQLRRPFPYYSRKYNFFFTVADNRMIRVLNKKLHKFSKIKTTRDLND